jgi:uncharacterized membrane protein (UPF0127 family)
MIIINTTKNSTLAKECAVADSFIKRFIGLMGKENLPEGGGLLITPCNSIHMFFMNFPLDIVFINKDRIIVHLIENIKPWQVSKVVFDARSTLELPVGTISTSSTQVGDVLKFE